MKFCTDCKWIKFDEFSPRCGHPSSSHKDPVTGDTKLYFCQLERMYSNGCGIDGKNWEAK